MTDQQKKAVEEAVKRRTISPLSRTGFRLGAEEVINHPEKYGLVPASVHENLTKKYKDLVAFYDKHVGTPCEEIRHRAEVERLKDEITTLKEDSDRLRSIIDEKGYW